jgi:hypothetical protein
MGRYGTYIGILWNVGLGVYAMKINGWALALVLTNLSYAVIGLFFVFFPEQHVLYKQGQIDCATGKMQYELKKQADGSITWERK